MTKATKIKTVESATQRLSDEIARIMIGYVDKIRRTEYRRRHRKEKEANY